MSVQVNSIKQASEFRSEYELVTNSQDIADTLDSIGWYKHPAAPGIGSLFVLVGDGEYLEVWKSTYSVPVNTDNYIRIF